MISSPPSQQQPRTPSQPSAPPKRTGLYEVAKLVQPPNSQHLRFGPYKLLHTLGEGEFGKVKLAELETLGAISPSYFAIKFVKKTILSSESRREKLDREIAILQTLSHKHIIQLHQVLESEKYIGLIMEYASGGELFNHILTRKNLSETESRRFFKQLISGVKYLHDNNIVHRDLKLENLLLDSNRNIKITDFGFANFLSDNLLNTSCGSPCYAAPELVLSHSYSGEAADVWSCGVILYSMLCGYLPFDDDPENPESGNVGLLYRYILRSELKFPSWVTFETREFVKRLMAVDPLKRITMDSLLSHPWMTRDSMFMDLPPRLPPPLVSSRSGMPAIKEELLQNGKENNAATNQPFRDRAASLPMVVPETISNRFKEKLSIDVRSIFTRRKSSAVPSVSNLISPATSTSGSTSGKNSDTEDSLNTPVSLVASLAPTLTTPVSTTPKDRAMSISSIFSTRGHSVSSPSDPTFSAAAAVSKHSSAVVIKLSLKDSIEKVTRTLAEAGVTYTVYSQVEKSVDGSMFESDVRIECLRKARIIMWRDVVFTVEISKNSDDGFRVECRRNKGDKWEFKRIYDAFFETLRS